MFEKIQLSKYYQTMICYEIWFRLILDQDTSSLDLHNMEKQLAWLSNSKAD